MDIELQFKDNFVKYKKELVDLLNKMKKERQALIERFSNGELLTIEDTKQNKRLAENISILQARLDKFLEVEIYDKIEDALIELNKPNVSYKKKEKDINFLIRSFKDFNKRIRTNLANLTNLTEQELTNISTALIETRRQVVDLGLEIRVLKKRGFPYADVEKEKETAEAKLKLIEQFQQLIFNESELGETLKNIALNKTQEEIKEAIISKYRKIIGKHRELEIKNLAFYIKNNPIKKDDELTETDNKEQSIEQPAENNTGMDENKELNGSHFTSIAANIPQGSIPEDSSEPNAELDTDEIPDASLDDSKEPDTGIDKDDKDLDSFKDHDTGFVDSNEPDIKSSDSLDESLDGEYEPIAEEPKPKGWFKRWLFGGTDYEDEYDDDYEYVDDDYYALENENSFKYKTKQTLKKIGSTLKKSFKPVAKIGGTVILVAAIILTNTKCRKDNKNKNYSNDMTNDFTIETTFDTPIETTEEIVINPTVNSLVNKGYTGYAANLMVDTFDDEMINKILNTPYNAAVENYASIKDFNIDYLLEYENARQIYNITSGKAVDYVNRSVKIIETGFYTDLTINEVVGVLKSVDNKDIFLDETNAFNHSINAALTVIYNDYAFGNGSVDNSIKKIEALKYFAPDGSDLDIFLTKYSEIVKNVLKSRGNTTSSEEAKNNMYNYLDIFANTFAGNIQGVNNIDQDAVVIDTFDWNTAYITFIRPLMSMFITENNAEKFACLQINMLSNYEQWIQINGYCPEETMTLGGVG